MLPWPWRRRRSTILRRLRGDPVSAQTEMRRERHRDARRSGSMSALLDRSVAGSGLRGPRVAAQTAHTRPEPEVAGIKSEDWKASLEPECKLHRRACSKQRHNDQA